MKLKLAWWVHHPSMAAATLVFVATLAVRLTYMAESRSSPFFATPVVDAQTYVERAGHIAGGDILGPDNPFWQAPLYPYFLGSIARIWPEPALFTAARIAQALLAAASAVMLYRLTRRFGPTLAMTVTCAYALYGPLVYFDGELLGVSLETFLYLALLTALFAAWKAPSRRAWAGAGLLGGLSALVRPNILLFIVALPLWLHYSARSRPATSPTGAHSSAWSTPYRSWAWVILGVVIAIAPVTTRNWIVGGEPVLISSNGGINFYIGNNARYDSTVAIHPGHHWEELVLEPVRAGHDKHAARSRYFYDKALAWASDHPLAYAQLLARKTWLFWAGPELKRNVNIHYARSHSHVLATLLWERGIAFPFGLIAPLALLGLALTARQRDPGLALLRLFVAVYSFSVIVFFVSARYRAPLIPALLLFAGLGAFRLYALIKSGRYRVALIHTIPLVILLAALNRPSGDPSPDRDAQLQRDLGEVYLRREKYDQAAHYSRLALELNPELPTAHHNLAVAYLGLNRYEEAAEHARWAVDRVPRRADSRVVLARALIQLGQTNSARSQLELALNTAPSYGQAHLHMGRLLLHSGAPGNALPHLEEAVRQLGGFWTSYDVGRAYQATGDHERALAAYRQALTQELRPEGFVALAVVHLLRQDAEAAIRYSRNALQLNPEQAEAYVNLGYAMLLQGNPEAAVTYYQQALVIRPDLEPARRGLLRARRAAGYR